jgi:hypothetical protein
MGTGERDDRIRTTGFHVPFSHKIERQHGVDTDGRAHAQTE